MSRTSKIVLGVAGGIAAVAAAGAGVWFFFLRSSGPAVGAAGRPAPPLPLPVPPAQVDGLAAAASQFASGVQDIGNVAQNVWASISSSGDAPSAPSLPN